MSVADNPTHPAGALIAAVSMAGGQSAFARLVGVSQTSVWRWIEYRKVLPAEHVLCAEAATGVSRHDLRPDLYPREHGSSLLADANLVDAAS
jgi:DNA-binding transcriptional regulator YdaS (Cro superfamily)